MRVFMADLWTQVPFYDVHLAQALMEAGLDLTLGAITYHLDPQAFQRYGIQNDPGPLDVIGRLRLPGALRRSLKLLESHLNLGALYRRVPRNFDLVHIQYLATFERGLETEWRMWKRMRERFGLPLVYTVHNILPHNKGSASSEHYARLYQAMDALICHSEHVKLDLMKTFGCETKRIWVIPHGPLFGTPDAQDPAEYKKQLRLAPGTTLFLMQGVISEYKGADILLRAWKIFRNGHQNAHLVISGTGDAALQARLLQLATELGVLDSISLDFRFIPVHELQAMYRAADVAVYPYRQISTSGALLTGIAFAKAIIASDLPPFREALGDEGAQWAPAEDPQALAIALGEMHCDQALRARLSARVQQLQNETISWRSIAERTISCYEAVLTA
jgi:glycosyltransferase involved in cell wall biosynthesis